MAVRQSKQYIEYSLELIRPCYSPGNDEQNRPRYTTRGTLRICKYSDATRGLQVVRCASLVSTEQAQGVFDRSQFQADILLCVASTTLIKNRFFNVCLPIEQTCE